MILCAVPTVELELENMDGYLVGENGKMISETLEITYVHNTVSAVGMGNRELTIIRAYAQVRQVHEGQALQSVSLSRRTTVAKL